MTTPWRAFTISRRASRLLSKPHPRHLHLPSSRPPFQPPLPHSATSSSPIPPSWTFASFAPIIFGSLPKPRLGFPSLGLESSPLPDPLLPPTGSILSTGSVSDAGGVEESLRSFIRDLSKNQVEDAPFLLQSGTTSIRGPGFLGSEDLTMEADSVKRKRKKKMNKHKHRKLRRLARKSKK